MIGGIWDGLREGAAVMDRRSAIRMAAERMLDLGIDPRRPRSLSIENEIGGREWLDPDEVRAALEPDPGPQLRITAVDHDRRTITVEAAS